MTVSGCAREHVAHVLGRHDEVHRDAAPGLALEPRLVVVERAHDRRAGRAHRIGEEHDAPLDVAADLRVVPRRADDLARARRSRAT